MTRFENGEVSLRKCSIVIRAAPISVRVGDCDDADLGGEAKDGKVGVNERPGRRMIAQDD